MPTKPLDRLQNGHRARDEERADISLPHLRRLAQPGFAARRVLLWHEPKPCGKVAPSPEAYQIRGECLDRKCRDRAHARYLL